MIANRRPQTLPEALGVLTTTQVINFKQKFGYNPIQEGDWAAKYLNKPHTLAEELGVKTQVKRTLETTLSDKVTLPPSTWKQR
jgi:hypothetical protein